VIFGRREPEKFVALSVGTPLSLYSVAYRNESSNFAAYSVIISVVRCVELEPQSRAFSQAPDVETTTYATVSV